MNCYPHFLCFLIKLGEIDVFTKSWYWRGELHNGFWCANLKEKNHLQDQGVEGVEFLYILNYF